MLLCASLSKLHKDQPWGMDVKGERYEVGYWPGDSKSGMFGGNSNWRGPICKPALASLPLHLTHHRLVGLATNFLLIESLQRFYQYYGDDLQVCMKDIRRILSLTVCDRWNARQEAVII
jgi:hypothetical protein